MTLPGVVQVILLIVFTIGTFHMYFEHPGKIVGIIFTGIGFSLLGLILIFSGWFGPDSLNEVWNFQANDFYHGTEVLTLGVGMILGNLTAWLLCKIKRLVK